MIRDYSADCALHTEDAQDFFNAQVLLHLHTAERHLDKMPLSFSFLCICRSVCFQTVCAATEIPGLLEVNKTFLGRLFHIL